MSVPAARVRGGEEPGTVRAERRRAWLLEHAGLIAAAIGEGFAARAARNGLDDRAEFHGPNGEVVNVVAGADRFTAYGIYPQVGRNHPSDYGRPRTITFAADKRAEQMGAEIRRRLLPHVQELHRHISGRLAERNRRIFLRRMFLEEAAALLPGLTWPTTHVTGREPESTEASGTAGGIHVSVAIPEYRSDQVNLEISKLDRWEALQVIQTLAAIRALRAS